jgi:acetate kinase
MYMCIVTNYKKECLNISKRSLQASLSGIKQAKRQFDLKGWTQEYLAIEVGTKTRQPIYRFFAGKAIERYTFFEICARLDLDWREIADNPPAEPNNHTAEELTTASNISNLATVSSSLPSGLVEVDKRHYGLNESVHQYCAERAAKILERDLNELRLITCNLDGGCSLAAIHNGQIIDTVIGFTPLEGLMIDYSSGSIDPSVLSDMMRQDNNKDDSSNRETVKESNLMDVAQKSEDPRSVTSEIETDSSKAKQALNIYINRLRSCLGSMLMSLGGMDGLVFTDESSENAEIIRELICQSLKFLGLKLDLEQNQSDPIDSDIATTDSKVRVLVIQPQEA